MFPDEQALPDATVDKSRAMSLLYLARSQHCLAADDWTSLQSCFEYLHPDHLSSIIGKAHKVTLDFKIDFKSG